MTANPHTKPTEPVRIYVGTNLEDADAILWLRAKKKTGWTTTQLLRRALRVGLEKVTPKQG